jgi:NADPH2:quinone reductase
MILMSASEKEVFSIHSELIAGLENGSLHPVIGREYPISEAPRAQHEVIESNAYGKIVLIP